MSDMLWLVVIFKVLVFTGGPMQIGQPFSYALTETLSHRLGWIRWHVMSIRFVGIGGETVRRDISFRNLASQRHWLFSRRLLDVPVE